MGAARYHRGVFDVFYEVGLAARLYYCIIAGAAIIWHGTAMWSVLRDEK